MYKSVHFRLSPQLQAVVPLKVKKRFADVNRHATKVIKPRYYPAFNKYIACCSSGISLPDLMNQLLTCMFNAASKHKTNCKRAASS